MSARSLSILGLAVAIACGGSSSNSPGTGSGGPDDAGSPIADAGLPLTDAGLPADAGAPQDDAGTPPPATDAGAPVDGGSDAGSPGAPTDGGTTDGGTTAFRYDLIDLGSELGDGVPLRIRDDGIIIGIAIISGQGEVLFSYDLASKVVTRPVATAGTFEMIDGHGNGVGVTGDDANARGFLQRGSTVTALGTLDDWFTRASDFNSSFQVVGTSAVHGDPGPHNFIWQENVMTDLGESGDSGLPLLINSSGQVAGTLHPTKVNDGSEHAFVYSKGVVRDLGTLGGGGITCTLAFNDLGHVTGFSPTPEGFNHVFFWDGAMHDLTPGAASTAVTEVHGINDADIVVGAMGPESDSRAFALLDGKIVDLNEVVAPSGFKLWHATGINSKGQIVGIGGDADGKNPRTFLLDPR